LAVTVALDNINIESARRLDRNSETIFEPLRVTAIRKNENTHDQIARCANISIEFTEPKAFQ
jgi:hypothetical protein